MFFAVMGYLVPEKLLYGIEPNFCLIPFHLESVKITNVYYDLLLVPLSLSTFILYIPI